MTEHRRGPARSEAARVAILAATARQFAEKGYDRLTMEGIAADAGVGKQTIYRWWSSKGALITDCLIEGLLLSDDLTPPYTGELRADLITWLANLHRIIERPGEQTMMRSLIAAAAENPDVGGRLYDSLGTGSELIVRLERAIDDGQLAPTAPLPEIGEALVGSILFRLLSRKPTGDDDIERIIAAVLPRTTR